MTIVVLVALAALAAYSTYQAWAWRRRDPVLAALHVGIVVLVAVNIATIVHGP